MPHNGAVSGVRRNRRSVCHVRTPPHLRARLLVLKGHSGSTVSSEQQLNPFALVSAVWTEEPSHPENNSAPRCGSPWSSNLLPQVPARRRGSFIYPGKILRHSADSSVSQATTRLLPASRQLSPLLALLVPQQRRGQLPKRRLGDAKLPRRGCRQEQDLLLYVGREIQQAGHL